MFAKKLVIALIFMLSLACGSLQAGGDVAKGQELSANCVDCHGENGEGLDDAPAIGGMDEMKHLEALKAYKSGERVDEGEVMQMFTEELSEQDMADLAAYYATLGGNCFRTDPFLHDGARLARAPSFDGSGLIRLLIVHGTSQLR